MYDEVLDIHKIQQEIDLPKFSPAQSTYSSEDDTPATFEKQKSVTKQKKETRKPHHLLLRLNTYKPGVLLGHYVTVCLSKCIIY